MATSLANASPLEWAGASDGTQPIVRLYSEGTSETFVKGDLVIYDASENGIVQVTQGDGGVYGDSDDDEVANGTAHLGIAMEDASGTAGTLLSVLLPRPQDFFSAVLFSTDNTTIAAPDTDNIGTSVDFIKGDTNNNAVTGVLEGTTAGIWANIVGISEQDVLFRGGTPGQGMETMSAGDRVIVRFQPSALSAEGYQA